MKTSIIPLATLLLVSSIALAVTTIDAHNFALSPKENLTISLKAYSYVNIRAYEGSTITVNMGKSTNYFTIASLKDDGTATVHFGDREGAAKVYPLSLGAKPTQVEINDDIPVLYLENTIFRESDDPKERNVVLKFTVPVLKKFSPNNQQRRVGSNSSSNEKNLSGTLRPNGVGKEEVEFKKEQKDPYLKYFIAIIIVLLVIIILLGPKPKKKGEEQTEAKGAATEKTEKDAPKPAKKSSKKEHLE